MKIALVLASIFLIAGYATMVGFVLMLVSAASPKVGEEILAPLNRAGNWLSA